MQLKREKDKFYEFAGNCVMLLGGIIFSIGLTENYNICSICDNQSLIIQIIGIIIIAVSIVIRALMLLLEKSKSDLEAEDINLQN